MLAYRLIRGLLGWATLAFFRRVVVVGRHHIPREGEAAVLFCGNHPNSLLDPILVMLGCRRILHFAAKDTLFANPVARALLNGLGAVPVRRRMDHGAAPLDNDAAFTALHDILARRRAAGIFPEGISHDRPFLASLKTGAARIILGAKAKHPETPMCIVPTGLHYFHRNRFRSSVLVQFGAPIWIDADAAAEPDKARVSELTGEIETGLRALTVNAEDWETLRVLDGVRRLYQPEGIKHEERVELSRRFNQVYPQVKEKPEVRALYQRVAGYVDRLDATGLDDDALRRDLGPAEVAARFLGHLALLVLWLPLALLGAPLHLPIYGLLKVAGRKLAPRKDVIATTKFVLGIASVLLLYLVLAVWAGLRWGWPVGVAAAVLQPLTGAAMLRVMGRAESLRRILSSSVRMLALRREVAALREERAQLAPIVAAAVEENRPADMVPLFPR